MERRFRDNRGILLESKRMLLLCKLFCLHENTIKVVMPSNSFKSFVNIANILNSGIRFSGKQYIKYTVKGFRDEHTYCTVHRDFVKI